MKKINIISALIISVLCTSMVFTSCKKEESNFFDESAAARIQTALDNTKQVLLSAPNGWVIEYYGSPESYSYGGYNIICKFVEDANGNHVVTALSEQMYKNSNGSYAAPVKSHFKLEQSAGCILSFDEFNSVIHYFSNPKNPDGLGDLGIGFGGDLEFRILSATPEEIWMTGKKHNARIRMTPILPEQTITDEDVLYQVWRDYFNEVKYVESEMVFNSYNLFLNGDTIPVTPDNRSLKFRYWENETDTAETVKQICYIITPEGLKLYKSFSVRGDSVTGFRFIDDADSYPTFENPDSKLVPQLPGLSSQLTNADRTWYLSYSNMGEYGQAQWSAAKVLIDKAKETMTAANMRTKSGNFGLYFTSNDGKKSYNFGYYITATKISDEEVKFVLKPITGKKSCDGDGYSYYNKKDKSYQGYDMIIDPFAKFAADGGRTFTLTTDRQKKPTWIQLTDKDDPTNVIRVTTQKPDMPFD